MPDKPSPTCARCAISDRACMSEDGRGPDFCPTRNLEGVIETALKEYDKPEIRAFAKAASQQEAACYVNRNVKPYVMHPVKPRVQEVCEFAHRMGYKKIGIAHCMGLRSEAKILQDILEAQGFEALSACCKVGAVPKEYLGLAEDEKIKVNEFETMCNPIAQAAIFNDANSDFNILVGLCVGHDSLFFKYSDALCTVLVAKDRVTGHNPAAALYTSGTYYARLKRPGFEREE